MAAFSFPPRIIGHGLRRWRITASDRIEHPRIVDGVQVVTVFLAAERIPWWKFWER